MMSWNPSSAPSALESNSTIAPHSSCSGRSGVIVSRSGSMARARVSGIRTCATCSCSRPLHEDNSAPPRTITVHNTVDAQIGQKVLIASPGKAKAIAPGILFGIPFLGLLAGALVGNWAAPFSAEDLNTLIGAGLGLTLGFIAARIISTLGFTAPQFLPQAIEILPEHPDRLE